MLDNLLGFGNLLAIYWNWQFIGIKIIIFKHVSAEILPKNLSNLFIVVHLCIKCKILEIILFKY